MTMTHTVAAQLLAHDGIPETTIVARLAYDTTDPFAIGVTFTMPGEIGGDIVPWIMARDLVAQAFAEGTAGSGDVMLTIDAIAIHMSLMSPEGDAVVKFHRSDFLAFHVATLDACPIGAETVDVDACIRQLLDA